MPPPAPKPPFRVQIICETALEYFRSIKLSVRHYGFTTGRMKLVDNWYTNLLYDPVTNSMHPLAAQRKKGAGRHPDLAAYVRENRIDGIIAQVKERDMIEQLTALDIPVVDIADRFRHPEFPTVTQNYPLVAEQAAEHLIECGGAAFGFWGQREAVYSETLRETFLRTVKERLPEASLFQMHSDSILNESGQALVNRMERWLKKLPSPLGIFTTGDTFGLHLMQAAQNLSLRIPEDVAILCAGDDPYWVDFGNIPLSSIRYNPKGIGHEAAALLDLLLTKRIRRAPNRYVGGSEVCARRSTDVLFVEDKAISKAVAYIRRNAHRNIYVGDVVKASGVSRTALHLRFKSTLGRSVLEEIHSARIRHAQMLLRTTDMPLTEVAEACDFPDTPALHVMFRRITSKTPAKYRAAFRQL